MRPALAATLGFATGAVLASGMTSRWGGDFWAFLAAIPQPIATIIGTIAGFGVVAWQARIALRAVIAGQNHRAQIEESGRQDQDRLDRQRLEEDRRYEKKVLAAALSGELGAIIKGAMNTEKFLRAQKAIYEAAAQDRSFGSLQAIPVPSLPRMRIPVFEANISKLGILGPSIAGDVATVYSQTIVEKLETSDGKLTPEYAAKMSDMLADFLHDWVWAILQVQARLLHVQFGHPDPGHLGDEVAVAAYRSSFKSTPPTATVPVGA